MLLAVSIISIIFFKFFVKAENAIAVIKQDGKIIEKIDLSKVKEKRQLKINYNDRDHKGYNIIEIDNGSIRFIDADCPDKVCVKSGVIYMKNKNYNTRKMIFLSLMVGIALIIYIIEAQIPVLFPGIKLGLANVISLVTLIMLGGYEALLVMFLRTL